MEVIDIAALGDSQHALGCFRGVDALMWQSPLLAPVVGRGEEEGAFGPRNLLLG